MDVRGLGERSDRKTSVRRRSDPSLKLSHQVLAERGDYYIIAAVRDVAKMKREAERMGIPSSSYQALECELADLASVKKVRLERQQVLARAAGGLGKCGATSES